MRFEELRLRKLKNKEERMKTALGRVKDNLNTLLSSSKSFETKSMSKTEANIGNVERCIVAVDNYLSVLI